VHCSCASSVGMRPHCLLLHAEQAYVFEASMSAALSSRFTGMEIFSSTCMRPECTEHNVHEHPSRPLMDNQLVIGSCTDSHRKGGGAPPQPWRRPC
jgi:hypothetical protein